MNPVLRLVGVAAADVAGVVRSAGGVWSGAGEGDADQDASLVDHGLAVGVPVVVLASDLPVVVDQGFVGVG
jgi:hypothetical protein